MTGADTGLAAEAGQRFDRRAIPRDAVESRWHAADGHAIRRIDWVQPPGTAPRGSLLFLPGRGDAYEKYLESFEHWHALGWNVTSTDWRGQAGSGREGLDPLTGHIADFGVWIADLAGFWALWKAANPAPHVLVGHSMGGHLALRALAEHRADPDAAVLTAPMLGVLAMGLPAGLLHLAARAMVALGDPRRPAWTSDEKPAAVPAERIALLTHDRDRYEDELWWRTARPELAMGPASWGWVERGLASIRALVRPGVLEQIKVPVQIFATTADRLVAYGAIARAARRLPHAQLISFGDEARHELLRESDQVRGRVLAEIDDFLAREAPPPAPAP